MAKASKARKVIVYQRQGRIVESVVSKTFPDGRFTVKGDATLYRPDGYGVETFPRRLPMVVDWNENILQRAKKMEAVNKLHALWSRLMIGEGATDLALEQIKTLTDTVEKIVMEVESREVRK